MSQDLLALLQLGLEASVFGAESRYQTIASTTMVSDDGETIVYLTRRFISKPEKLTTVGQAVVAQGDRLDTMATTLLGDSLLYWRIADANLSLSPADLEQVGQRLRITQPEEL